MELNAQFPFVFLVIMEVVVIILLIAIVPEQIIQEAIAVYSIVLQLEDVMEVLVLD